MLVVKREDIWGEVALVAGVAAFQVFTAHAGGERGESATDLDALGLRCSSPAP